MNVTNINKNYLEMIDTTDRCVCGHMVRNHPITMKKRFTITLVITECKLCNCKDLHMEHEIDDKK